MHYVSESLKPDINPIHATQAHTRILFMQIISSSFSSEHSCTFPVQLCPTAVDIFAGFDLVVHPLTVTHMSAIFKTYHSSCE